MKTSNKSVSEYQYLIIGGTTKAATTSLFSYLSDHPDICAATYKETRFFLSTEYPLPSKYRFNGDVEVYNQLFSDCQEKQIRLESTPDYLYCSSALERIAEFLPNAKLVISLREPISRIISWYRFALQIGRIPDSMGIDEYVDRLFKIEEEREKNTDQGIAVDTNQNVDDTQFMQVLPQGRYAVYLKNYIDSIGIDRIRTIYFEDLSKNPSGVMKELCHFSELDSTFYDDYTFQVTNRTETMRNPVFHRKYRSFRFQVRRWTHGKPVIHKTLCAMKRGFEPLYMRLNTQTADRVTLSENTQERLEDYYKQDIDDLSNLLGKAPPWELYSLGDQSNGQNR